jgi:flavocytochrome c
MKMIHRQRRTVIASRAWKPKGHPTEKWTRNERMLLLALFIAAVVWVDVLLWRPASTDVSREGYSSDLIPVSASNDGPPQHAGHGNLRPLRRHDSRKHFEKRLPLHSIDIAEFEAVPTMADAVIVGSGLAGLTAALTILDRGGTVIIFEKEPILGGNSNKASSGINACCLEEDWQWNDTLSLFRDDTAKSAGRVADFDLIDTLVGNSAKAVTWLHERVGVDLSVLAQLGGHSRKRTHRPRRGFVGAEIMASLETAIRAFEPIGRVNIYLNTQVTQLVADQDGDILGVVTESRHGEYGKIRSDHVILATGGFASDRSHGSLLEKYRPDLLGMPATAGEFSTGDGIEMAEMLGASTRDMEKIQLHPTGFVDRQNPTNPNKVLAAEMLRGVGGVLVDGAGERFCNELGTRDYVSKKMLQHNRKWSISRLWHVDKTPSKFYLLLSEAAASEANRHVRTYTNQGLLKKYHGLDELSESLSISKITLHDSLKKYRLSASRGKDEFGKTVFENIPSENFAHETFVVGEVTPVLHYCMGGLTIDPEGNVLRNDGDFIDGLYAAGEVTGGVHGNNRLGGNSLLECAVFGGIIGRNIPINHTHQTTSLDDGFSHVNRPVEIVSMKEVAKHHYPGDCWVSLYGIVYDLSSFAEQHPGGTGSILALAGTDGTKVFDAIHSPHMLDILQNRVVGVLDLKSLETADDPSGDESLRDVSLHELKHHSTNNDLWVVIHGIVYDLTSFSHSHPGGAYLIQKLAGKDATDQFQVFHPPEKLAIVQKYAVGRFVSDMQAPNTSFS